MKKSKLVDGTPFYGIRVEHFVTKHVFARAMASYCWTYNKEFDINISKRQAMKLLKKQLFQQGIQGLYTDNWDGASEEYVSPFNDAYDKATAWVDNNYPYLK